MMLEIKVGTVCCLHPVFLISCVGVLCTWLSPCIIRQSLILSNNIVSYILYHRYYRYTKLLLSMKSCALSLIDYAIITM